MGRRNETRDAIDAVKVGEIEARRAGHKASDNLAMTLRSLSCFIDANSIASGIEHLHRALAYTEMLLAEQRNA